LLRTLDRQILRHQAPLPAHQPPSLALRTLAALAGIVGLQLVRYLAFRSEYQADPALWLVIAGSLDRVQHLVSMVDATGHGVEGTDRCQL
jgi:hypothetical protein